MKELEKYKQNGYHFDDPFANKSELKCIKERWSCEFVEDGECDVDSR